MLKRLRRDSEAVRGKDAARGRRARERRQTGKAAPEPAKPVERKASKTMARRKARSLKAAVFHDRPDLARRNRRIRRPSTLRMLPRKIRGLLRDLT